MNFRRIRKGTAFLMSLVVLVTLSAWAVSIYSISGSNLQLADNQRKADGARACAESGLEIMRFWLNRFSVSGMTDTSLVFSNFASWFPSYLGDYGITNITPHYDGSRITVPAVTLDSATERTFSVQITQVGSETLQVDVTGTCGSVAKTIRANYKFGVRPDTVFDFGVATRGPLSLSGNIALDGVNVSVESDVFIESLNQNEALSIIGNSKIAGQVKITNPAAYVTLQGGQASIGGEKGSDALKHVTIGYTAPEFPVPDPGRYVSWATNVINASTSLPSNATFENVRIAAGTNPIFSNKTTLKGVVYIETPNVVTFSGSAKIVGIIVGAGNVTDNSSTNQINFLGTVDSQPVTELPAEPRFAGLENEKHTFLLAPGFHVSFGGNFATLNGAIAGNGIEFFGNAGGVINGTIINYSDVSMTLSGNSDLYFNRTGIDKVPAGFVQDIVLHYVPESYTEVAP